MALITCQNLSLGYDGRVIIQNLSFDVQSGDYLCVVGENGAGKSTLIRTILGLQPPLMGQILMGEGLCQKEIGYLPQQTAVQKDFPASVWEIVLSGCQGRRGIKPFYSRENKALAAENIERMELAELKNRCYRELSGGQQQRVLLARALCATGRILLLDEPTAGLDPKVTHELYQVIRELNRDGITIIMVSHDILAATKYADHILHIGGKIFFGPTKEYIKSGMGRYFITERGEES